MFLRVIDVLVLDFIGFPRIFRAFSSIDELYRIPSGRPKVLISYQTVDNEV